MIKLQSKTSFYGYNQNGSLNRRIEMGSVWVYLGVENERHKLQKIYKNSFRISYVFVSKSQIKENFKVIGEGG